MTLQQEAYEMMNGMSDDNIRFIMEVIRRITPAETEEKSLPSNARTKKMQAFENLERMRKQAVFHSDFDYEKEIYEAIGEKYGGFA